MNPIWLIMKNLSDNPLRYDVMTYDNIQKIATVRGDDCTTGCLVDYN